MQRLLTQTMTLEVGKMVVEDEEKNAKLKGWWIIPKRFFF